MEIFTLEIYYMYSDIRHKHWCQITLSDWNFCYGNIPFWFVLKEKFSEVVYFDIWHKDGCQITRSCILCTYYSYLYENILFRVVWKEKFFGNIYFDTGMGVKLHFFLYLHHWLKLLLWKYNVLGSLKREIFWQYLFSHFTRAWVSNYTVSVSTPLIKVINMQIYCLGRFLK